MFRTDNHKQFEILLAQHSGHHGWVFPKGHIEVSKDTGKKETPLRQGFAGQAKEIKGRRETKEEAALREVKEETGVEGKIIRELAPISYWFVQDGEKIKKTVYYFLMEYAGGSIEEHDLEMENVEWITADKVEERLTYPSDKSVWQEARQLL